MRSRHSFLALAAALALGGGLAGRAQAAPAYTAFVGNDQCPTNNSVSQVTGETWTLGATVAVGSCPAGIAFTPDGRKAWIANAGDSTITPIDPATFQAGAPFPAGVSAPIFLAVTPNGKALVTGGAGSNMVALFSTDNPALTRTVAVGLSPNGVAILPNSSGAYVGNTGDGTVSLVTIGTKPVLEKTITFPAPGCAPYGMAASPDGASVYASCSNGSLWRIDTKTNKADAAPIAIPQASGGAEVVITSNGKTAYVSNTNGFVYPVKLKGGVVGAPIPVAGAYGLALSSDGKQLMVGNGNCCFVDTPVSIVSTATNAVTATLETPGLYTHRWLAFKP